MNPFRERPEVAESSSPSGYEPRLLWEGRLYPDNETAQTQRIRVVHVFEQKGSKLVEVNKVEIMLDHTALGEPRWVSLPSTYEGVAVAALAAAFR